VAYIRKFKTASGATGVQVCYKEHSKIVKTVHVGSANSPEGLNRLLIKAQEIIDETLSSVESERTSRVIDRDSGAASMEKRKREGYF